MLRVEDPQDICLASQGITRDYRSCGCRALQNQMKRFSRCALTFVLLLLALTNSEKREVSPFDSAASARAVRFVKATSLSRRYFPSEGYTPCNVGTGLVRCVIARI